MQMYKQLFFKTLLQKEKMLYLNNFSNCHFSNCLNAFNSIQYLGIRRASRVQSSVAVLWSWWSALGQGTFPSLVLIFTQGS